MTTHVQHQRTSNIARLRTPALLVQGALALWVLMGVTALVCNLVQRSLLHRVETSPWSVSLADLRADDARVDALNGVFVGLGIVTAVLFIIWFRRAYMNVDALGGLRGWGLGWAIGGWFVPIGNLFIPKQIAGDVNAAVCARLAPAVGDGALRRLRHWTNAWWAGWIALLVTGVLTNSTDRGEGQGVRQALTANTMYTVRSVVIVVAAVLALVMVRLVTHAADRVQLDGEQPVARRS